MRIGIVVRSDFVQLASKPHYHLFDKRESPSRIFKSSTEILRQTWRKSTITKVIEWFHCCREFHVALHSMVTLIQGEYEESQVSNLWLLLQIGTLYAVTGLREECLSGRKLWPFVLRPSWKHNPFTVDSGRMCKYVRSNLQHWKNIFHMGHSCWLPYRLCKLERVNPATIAFGCKAVVSSDGWKCKEECHRCYDWSEIWGNESLYCFGASEWALACGLVARTWDLC